MLLSFPMSVGMTTRKLIGQVAVTLTALVPRAFGAGGE